MGFRFRKSIKVAPGVKINLGKKGASVSVGKRGAKVTVGKTGVRTSVGAPGTGLSYTKHNAFKSTEKKNTSPPQTNSVTSGGQGPNNQMDWNTALKIIKWAFYAFLAFFIIMMASDSKAVYFGAAIIIAGMILTRLKRKSIINFKPTWIVGLVGWIMCFALWNTEVEPTSNTVIKDSESEINTLVSTPVQEENKELVVTDEKDAANEADSAVAETEVESEQSIVTEEPEIDVETVIEEPVTEPAASTPTPEREYFKNCKEMNAVYPNGVPSDHPAYDSARDRDKDGWACEK